MTTESPMASATTIAGATASAHSKSGKATASLTANVTIIANSRSAMASVSHSISTMATASPSKSAKAQRAISPALLAATPPSRKIVRTIAASRARTQASIAASSAAGRGVPTNRTLPSPRVASRRKASIAANLSSTRAVSSSTATAPRAASAAARSTPSATNLARAALSTRIPSAVPPRPVRRLCA